LTCSVQNKKKIATSHRQKRDAARLHHYCIRACKLCRTSRSLFTDRNFTRVFKIRAFYPRVIRFRASVHDIVNGRVITAKN